jgi:hypothetical protein
MQRILRLPLASAILYPDMPETPYPAQRPLQHGPGQALWAFCCLADDMSVASAAAMKPSTANDTMHHA